MAGIEESLALSLSQSELPRFDVFPSLIHSCRKNKSLEHAKHVETHMCNIGLDYHKALGNYSVTMFVECGSISDARKTFRKLPYRYESSWTALISAYFDDGEPEEAFHIYEHMKKDDVDPSTYTAVSMLKGCARSRDIVRGRSIHDEMKMKGLEHDFFVSSALIDMYAKCGSFIIAKEIFKCMQSPGLVTWNALISGYVDHGLGEEALRCFKEMQFDGIAPDSVTLTCCLKACGDIGAFYEGQEMHKKVVEVGLENLQVENTLISMYAKFGRMVEAQEIFDCMLFHDEVSWTALISGYTDQGLGQAALTCFEKMFMTGRSCDAIMLSSVAKACTSIGDIDEGRKVHAEIILKGFEEVSYAGNSLIDMYSTCGSLEEACFVFENLPNRNVVAWTTLIGGYAQHGWYQEALGCLEKMSLEGVVPNVISFVSLLDACGNIGAIEKGRKIHIEVIARGLEEDPSIDISLMSMYMECESLVEALDIFQKMKIRDVVAWSEMIRGYGMNHEGDMAIQCFEEMVKRGIKPDAITFTCLLNACSHTGHESKAQEYFNRMREMYDVVPSIEHYVCMIDILARSGNTYHAERFFEAQCPASEGTWGALLSACKTYGEVELGLRCFDNLCKIVPKDGAWYALMTDIFSSAGRLDDAHRVEKVRKHIGAWKKPGIASIEVNDKVHKFVVGNQYTNEIALKLHSLSLNVKNEGHMPNLNLISRQISDMRKETALHEHAEKLAIAFGLISTPQGTTLRVSKNMRMCNDCHSASKLISQMEKREIILRDECCIHHFKDGLCSCGDLF